MESTMTKLGKVTDFIGKKGELQFIDTNLAGSARVMVTMVSEDEESIQCWLSTALSAQVRAHEVKLRHLITFDYGVNEKGHHYIMRQAGNVISIKANKIKAEEYKPVEIDYTDYIAL